MIKYALFSINFIGLFIMNLLSDTEVMVENNTPSTLRPGEKKEVQITINKGDIQGFAKMELVLPAGLMVSAGETHGSSFTFAQQKAKFVWMVLPTEKSFTITYYLESLDGVTGTFDMNGTFSYIMENKRIDYFIPVRNVAVNKEEATAPQKVVTNTPVSGDSMTNGSSSSSNPSTSSSNSSSTSPDTNTSSSSASNTAGSANATSPSSTNTTAGETKSRNATTSDQNTASLSSEQPNVRSAAVNTTGCTRTITRLNDTDFRIDLLVADNSIKGFAKILESLPANCKAEKISDGGAVVTQEKNTIKFVWFEIPTSPEILVSYKVSCLSPSSSDPLIIGKLSFVENNNPKEIAINTVGQSAAIAENPVKVETPIEEPKQDIAENKPPKTEIKSENNLVKNTNKNPLPPVTSVPTAEKGVTYKVQILAAHRVVNKTYFKQKHSYDGAFNIENHEGWVKYTTGQFGEYKSARNERERLKSDYTTLPGPFVTAYNNGERITVQEALLISKQEWLQ